MLEPKIFLNDPRSVNSPRRQELAARIEAILEEGEELARKKAKKPVKKSSKIFDEKLHPREKTGRFTKANRNKKSVKLDPETVEAARKRLAEQGLTPEEIEEALKEHEEDMQRVFGKFPTWESFGDPNGDKKDIRNMVEWNGDQGFKNTLLGLTLGAINEVMEYTPGTSKIKIAKADLIWHGARGLYDPFSNWIGVETRGETRAITAIHEIGHFLDYNTKTASGRPLNEDPKLRRALENSPSMKTWKEKRNSTTSTSREKDVADYYLEPTEMFGRAYSQYIASRSSNSTLKKELNQRRDPDNDESDELWSDDDFEPIGREFDRIFKTKKKPKKITPKKKKSSKKSFPLPLPARLVKTKKR